MTRDERFQKAITDNVIKVFKNVVDLLVAGYDNRDGAFMRVMLADFLINWLLGYRNFWISKK
jgi:hypothetical protein